MQQNEYSIIKYPKMKHLKFYIVSIHYRYPHIHSAIEVSLILCGKLHQKTSQGIVTAEEGDLIITNSNEMHELSSDTSNVVMLSMQVSPSFCQDYCPSWGSTIYSDPLIHPYFTKIHCGCLRYLLCQAALSYWTRKNDSYFHCVALTCLLLEQLRSTLPQHEMNDVEAVAHNNKSARLNRMVSFIENHYTERNILSSLAAEEGVTLTYMSHFFHDNFHISFQKYLSNYRFERAMHLLTTTKRSILDICMETGFSDSRSLNALCQKTFGCSASECRRQNLKLLQSNHFINALTVQYMFSDQESVDFLTNSYPPYHMYKMLYKDSEFSYI